MSSFDEEYKFTGDAQQLSVIEDNISNFVSQRLGSAGKARSWRFFRLTDHPDSAANIVLHFLGTGAPPSMPLLQVEIPEISSLGKTVVGKQFNGQLVQSLKEVVGDMGDGDDSDEFFSDDLALLYKRYAAHLELYPVSELHDLPAWNDARETLKRPASTKEFVV